MLNQKITKKVTAQPIIAPTYPDIAPSEPDDDAPAVLEGATATASKTNGEEIPITGQTPLSEERF